MNDENHVSVARTPVKKDSQPGHQQLRARRFLGAVVNDSTAPTASTPVDPVKTRPVRRLTERRGSVTGTAVDLQDAFVNEQMHWFDDSPPAALHQGTAEAKKVPSIELQPACVSVTRSEEMVLVEGPASTPDRSDGSLVAVAGMHMRETANQEEEEEEEAEKERRVAVPLTLTEATERSTDALCEADSTPLPSTTQAPPAAAAPQPVVLGVVDKETSAPATPSPPSSNLPSDEDNEAESGYGSVRNHGEVSSLKDLTITPQRQCTSSARSAPSPSLAFDKEAGAVPITVACTPIKAASAALFTTAADSSSNACRPLASSFDIRPKATRRFDFVKAFAPLPVTPEKTAPRFTRGSAVEYQVARGHTTGSGSGVHAAPLTMRGEKWKQSPAAPAAVPPPPPTPPTLALEGSGPFQRVVKTTSHHSSTEEQPPRRHIRATERRASTMQMREKSPAGRQAPARPTVRTEPLEEDGDEGQSAEVWGQPTQPPPPVLSSEQVSPASPRSLVSAGRRVTKSGSDFASSPSPDPLASETQENFQLYRKRSFCVYNDDRVYEATNAAFKGGVTRTTLPRSAMPYDPHKDRQHRAQQAILSNEDDSDYEYTYTTGSSSSSVSSTSDSEACETANAITPPRQHATQTSASQTQLPGVDSTSMSSLSMGKHASGSTGRPTTSGGLTTRGVSSSNGCTTDERASHSTSREYDDGEGEISPNPQTDTATHATLPGRRRSVSGRLGLAATSDSEEDGAQQAAAAAADEDDLAFTLATNAFRFPLNQDDIVDLSAITIASLEDDGAGGAAVASKSYENFLDATTAPLAALRLDSATRRNTPAQVAAVAQQRALFEEAAAHYDVLLAEHRAALLESFLTLTERCLEAQRRAKEKKKAAIFGSKDALPLAIALPTATAAVSTTPSSVPLSPAHTTASHSGSFSHMTASPHDVFVPMERHTLASPYVSAATTVFGMAPRTSRPPSAPRSRRTSADENSGAVVVGESVVVVNAPSATLLAPKSLPKITPLFDAQHAIAGPAEWDVPFQSPLRLIFRLCVCAEGAEDKTAAMRTLLSAYFEYHLQEHLRRVQHVLFDFTYTILVGIPALRMLETHERRLICMSRDLLVRDRIELFMLTLPHGARAGSGSRTSGAVKLGSRSRSESRTSTAAGGAERGGNGGTVSGGGGGGTGGGLVSNFRSAYESNKTKTLTRYQLEKERLVAQWSAGGAGKRKPLAAASASSTAGTPMSAREEYTAGSGPRPESARASNRPRAASVSATAASKSLTARASAPRVFPSPAQISAAVAASTPTPQTTSATEVTDDVVAAAAAPVAPTLSSRTQRTALSQRSASLPNVGKALARRSGLASAKPTRDKVRNITSEETESEPARTLMVLSRGAPRNCQEGDYRTYRRISGEITLEDGTQLLRAKERIHPGPRERSVPPPPTEAQFMNLADLDPR